jgi:hypothetical protein
MNRGNNKIKETLLMRLNRSMAAIEIVPGVMVEVKKENLTTSGPRGFLQSFVKVQTDEDGDFLTVVEIKEGTFLLYLGVENLGPVGPYSYGNGSFARTKQVILGEQIFLAFKFLYEDYFVYLLILETHDYFNIFNKRLRRMGGITNFGK